jgi:hypothetical protein
LEELPTYKSTNKKKKKSTRQKFQQKPSHSRVSKKYAFDIPVQRSSVNMFVHNRLLSEMTLQISNMLMSPSEQESNLSYRMMPRMHEENRVKQCVYLNQIQT